MNWRKQVETLESYKEWNMIFSFMKRLIKENPNNIEAYIYIIYYFNNYYFYVLYTADKDSKKYNSYQVLATHYFQESYKKFSDSAKYLFFVGFEICVIPYFFGVEQEFADNMIYKAQELEPNHIIYGILPDSLNPEEQIKYAQMVLDDNSIIQRFLKSKGSPGKDVLRSSIGWAKQKLYEYKDFIAQKTFH